MERSTNPREIKCPRQIRCHECGHWIHHRPGDIYGCRCGCFTRFAATKEEVAAIVAQVHADDPDRPVVVDLVSD